ncbi:MAG: thioredoxin domain-containing protein [Sphingomonadales bacterium]|nr:thioredoxin domain-containing protein [Sphingomonadales bacterium]
MDQRPGFSRLAMFGLACALVGGVAGYLASTLRADRVIHDYLVTNPQVLPEAMEALRKQEDAHALAGIRADVERPFPGSVLGNPDGKVTLVEFTDFACGYCRKSVADVESLIAANPQLRVVVRQLPIIAPESADAARMGLAAAAQGKYAAFHHALFAIGKPDAAGVAEAARQAGLDPAAAQRTMADPAVAAEIDRNLEFARKLGFSGTPAWVAGDRLLSGAIGAEALGKAVARIGPHGA